MEPQRRNQIENLKREASRYSDEINFNGDDQRKSSSLERFITNMKPSQRASATAMAIGFPGLAPLILFAGTGSMHTLPFFICLFFVLLSCPIWFLARRLENSERATSS